MAWLTDPGEAFQGAMAPAAASNEQVPVDSSTAVPVALYKDLMNAGERARARGQHRVERGSRIGQRPRLVQARAWSLPRVPSGAAHIAETLWAQPACEEPLTISVDVARPALLSAICIVTPVEEEPCLAWTPSAITAAYPNALARDTAAIPKYPFVAEVLGLEQSPRKRHGPFSSPRKVAASARIPRRLGSGRLAPPCATRPLQALRGLLSSCVPRQAAPLVPLPQAVQDPGDLV